MDIYEEQLDLTKARITEIEKKLFVMHDNIITVADQVKETQMFLIKLAKNQAEISKRVSQWPFIAVPQQTEEDE
jgi:hypothetical protein